MPREVVQRVFEPMFTTKPFGQGTGLGLTIVHDIISGDFRGTIDVTSEVGVGTTFTFRLPTPASTRSSTTLSEAPPPPAMRSDSAASAGDSSSK